MRERSRLALTTLAALAVIGAAAVPSFEANLRRLRELPPERRAALANNLQRFHRLPRADQARLREIDRRIAEADPDIRERYFEVLRRFELWRQGLDDATRQRLDVTPPGERMALVRQLLEAQRPARDERLDDTLARFSNLHPVPLLDQVYQIRSWFALTPEQRSQVEHTPAEEQGELLERFGRENGIPDDRPNLTRRFQRDVSERLLARPARGLLLESMKAQAKEALSRRLIEARVLQGFEPDPVSRANLDRFTALLPAWMLESLDALPPVAARRRVLILYRLAFPAPQELPAEDRGEEPGGPASPGTPATLPTEPQPDLPAVTNPF